MPDVPLPFVVALLLAVLLGRMLVEGRERAAERGAIVFVAVAMLAAVVAGLHWSSQIAAARAAQPLVAALLPLGSRGRTSPASARSPSATWRCTGCRSSPSRSRR